MFRNVQYFLLSSYVHWMLLAITYVSLMLLLDAGGGDVWFASQLYQLQGQQWVLKDHWLTSNVLHSGARILNYFCVLTVFILLGYYLRQRKQNPQLFRATLALLMSLLLSFSIVAGLKAATHIACPWHLTLFGGEQPYFSLLSITPNNMSSGGCFPAGHASIGYAWLALYYFFLTVKPAWRHKGLTVGLITGLILGLTQQLRGAHFMSHDITTALICLLSAKMSFWFFTVNNRV